MFNLDDVIPIRVFPSYGDTFRIETATIRTALRYESLNDIPSYFCGHYISATKPVIEEIVNTRNGRLCQCEQCDELYYQDRNWRDPGICSISCGYKIRGLSISDFLDTSMDLFQAKVDVAKELGKY